MTAQKDIYISRINLALDYVNANIEKKISVQDLAEAAHFSSFHFHRIFQALMDESVQQYISRIKLEKSTQKLSYTDKTILEIALETGFSSVATFSRAFKNYFECTPSHYRKHGLPENSRICKKLSSVNNYIDDVQERHTVIVKELAFKNIAYITVMDSFKEGTVLLAINQLIEWSKEAGVYENCEIMGMSLDDVTITPEDKYRYVVGISLPDDFVCEHAVIKSMSIPHSKYATVQVSGSEQDVIDVLSYLFNDWLLNSAYEPNHLYAIERFLNKEKATDWSSFELELALPITSLIHYT